MIEVLSFLNSMLEVFLLFLLVRILAKTLQATTATETNWTYDQSWLAIMCTSPSVLKRHVAIARLKNPCNFGRNCQEARFIVFILSPMKEKGTKNFLETGRTFATIFADIELRAKLLKATTQQEFISIIDVILIIIRLFFLLLIFYFLFLTTIETYR